MIVGDVATRVRRTFGDESSVQITDDDIFRWINDAQEQIGLENEGLFEASAKTNVVAGTSQYVTPTDMSVIRSLSLQGTKLRFLSFNDFNEYIDGFEAPANLNAYGQGNPTVFTLWENKINLFPTPSQSITNGLYIYYIKHPTSVANLADSLTVPLQYHNAVVSYCLQQAYLLDEDVQKSAISASQFSETVMKLNGRNKFTQDYYPSVTVLPEDAGFQEGWF